MKDPTLRILAEAAAMVLSGVVVLHWIGRGIDVVRRKLSKT